MLFILFYVYDRNTILVSLFFSLGMKHCLLGAEAAPGIFRGQVRREGEPPIWGTPPGTHTLALCLVCPGLSPGVGCLWRRKRASASPRTPTPAPGQREAACGHPEGWDGSGEGWPAVGPEARTRVSASAEWMETHQDELRDAWESVL